MLSGTVKATWEVESRRRRCRTGGGGRGDITTGFPFTGRGDVIGLEEFMLTFATAAFWCRCLTHVDWVCPELADVAALLSVVGEVQHLADFGVGQTLQKESKGSVNVQKPGEERGLGRSPPSSCVPQDDGHRSVVPVLLH